MQNIFEFLGLTNHGLTDHGLTNHGLSDHGLTKTKTLEPCEARASLLVLISVETVARVRAVKKEAGVGSREDNMKWNQFRERPCHRFKRATFVVAEIYLS